MKIVSSSQKTQKILIVDDDESILDAISLILEDHGYIVETTKKGNETYKKVDTFHPDLILLDVLISGHDGRIICKHLKTDSLTKNIPVILISAHPNADKSMTESGANAFLPKPFESTELLKKISSLTSN